MGLIKNPTIPDDLCTLQTCSLLQAHYLYIPTLAGNSLFLGIFGLLLLIQVFFGIKYRTWGFLVGMIGGIVLEIIGYIGRVQMHYNPFTSNPFLMYLVCLTIGPAFLSASIYLCLARIVVIYGEGISRFRPAFYTITFICCDFFSLLLQAAGGAIASGATTQSTNQTGINIMIAGLSTQVASLVLFLALCAEFAFHCYQHAYEWEATYAKLRSTLKFKAFLASVFVSAIAILIRSCFRVAELKAGFHGSLANNEALFMVLDGVMVIIAVTVLTVLHPGVAFQGHWSAANFNLRKTKGLKSIDAEGGIAQTKTIEPKGRRWPMNFMQSSLRSKSKGPNAVVAERSTSEDVNEEPKPFRSISYEEAR